MFYPAIFCSPEDRQVQRLMDDLDLPKDRANLFEALDADSSGTLHLAELAQGLLKVRGELKNLGWENKQLTADGGKGLKPLGKGDCNATSR